MENRSQQPNVRFLYPRSAELLGFLEGFGIDPNLLDFIKLTQTNRHEDKVRRERLDLTV